VASQQGRAAAGVRRLQSQGAGWLLQLRSLLWRELMLTMRNPGDAAGRLLACLYTGLITVRRRMGGRGEGRREEGWGGVFWGGRGAAGRQLASRLLDSARSVRGARLAAAVCAVAACVLAPAAAECTARPLLLLPPLLHAALPDPCCCCRCPFTLQGLVFLNTGDESLNSTITRLGVMFFTTIVLSLLPFAFM
jgi:hypothetical protein